MKPRGISILPYRAPARPSPSPVGDRYGRATTVNLLTTFSTARTAAGPLPLPTTGPSDDPTAGTIFR